MIFQYSLGQARLILNSDLAGELPVYIYISENKKLLLYSKSITALLNDLRVEKPLKVSSESLSFLLQNGVVPPPKTAYENIFILGLGDTCEIATENNAVKVSFSHKFPFINAQRLQLHAMQPNEELILQMLAEATTSKLNTRRPSFLFHSAGKDSNSIALAMAEAGWQDQITLISHKSKGSADESEISAKIAKQLGFKHQVLREVDDLQTEHKQSIEEYFVNAPFPCTDNVSLAYPLYAHQLPELKGSNIIDGGGNDSYMMTPPTKWERKVIPLSKIAHHASFLRHVVNSESLLSASIRTSAERFGMRGFSYADTKQLLPDSMNVYTYWKQESNSRKKMDLFDYKTSILTPVVASELHIRKVRNFADAITSNLILPFANPSVAEYFAKMPESYLFDRTKLKNKLILRKILKERIGLDSDALGKLGFTYDSHAVVLRNWGVMSSEIIQCKLWNKAGIESVMGRLTKKTDHGGRESLRAKDLLYRLYLISSWHNHNKFLKQATH
jgi:asparagine synthase (glutamine-hydrolysing)